MTEETSQTSGAEQAPKPDFASCCKEMAAAMGEGGSVMERMMSACGPMMQRMMAACDERSDRSESAAEDPASAGS